MKAPTLKQAERLRVLADGYVIATPRRGEWVGLLRSGWVERIDTSTPRGGLLPPLRITDEGRRALATITSPEEGECIPTTSARTSRRAAASISESPNGLSSFSVSIAPRPASLRPRCSCVSSAPPIPRSRVAAVAQTLIPASEIQDLIDDLSRELDVRRGRRQRDWNAAITFRCASCKLFVRNPRGRCPHCGFDPDIGWAS